MPEGMIFQEEEKAQPGTGFPPATPADSSWPSQPPPPASNPHQSSSFPTIKAGHGGGFSGSSVKTILKIGLGIFVLLTIIFVVLTLIVPRVTKPTSEKVTLSYWGLWEDQNVMNGIISDFEKENPNITIDYKKQDPNAYEQRLVVRTQNGTGPDIFRFHNTWYPMLSGILLPLPKETIEKQEFTDNFYNVAQKDLIKNGAIYGIPLEIDTLSMYVNTAIFDSASAAKSTSITIPTTWQEFIDTSAQLTQRDDTGRISIAGAAIGTYENVNHAPDIISLLFAQNGVDMNDISKSETKVSDALRFYTNFALVENNIWDQTLDASLLAFSQGKLAMYFGYSWDYFSIKSVNPNLSFKVVPVPQLLDSDKLNIASYWAEGVSTKSKHQKEALLFMKFLAQKDTAEKLYTEESKTRQFGEPYGNKNLADKLKNSDSFVFVDQAKTAVSSPFVDGTYDGALNSQLDNYLKDSVNAILSGGSVETSTGTLLQGYSQVLGQYAAPAN